MADGRPWPKISIVTPSFNQGSYLEETIRSVLMQNYPNLEYIVIDGGSTDQSAAILEKYRPWLAYAISEPDHGQSDAINKGLQRCTGEIFNWLCSDDYLEPGALFEVAEALAGESDVFCGVSRNLHPDGTRSYCQTPLMESVERMIFVEHICQPATFFRLETIRRLGYLNRSLHYCMDAEWWVKYLLENGMGRIAHSESVLVNFRYHEASKSTSRTALFEGEFLAIKRAVLELFHAPPFLLAYYQEKRDVLKPLPGVHDSIRRRKLLSFYTRRSIKEAFLRREFGNLFLNILYDLYLKRGAFLAWGKDLRLLLPAGWRKEAGAT